MNALSVFNGGGRGPVGFATGVAFITSVVFAAAVVASCEVRSKVANECLPAYDRAFNALGIGAGLRAIFEAGFQTLNPSLRRREEDGDDPRPLS